VTVDNAGTLPAVVDLTFVGGLENPHLSTDDGQALTWVGVVPPGGTLIVDTGSGSATLDGVDVTGSLVGDRYLRLAPGETVLTLTTSNPDDQGTLEVCWRPTVGGA
jgi:hypothetical protein